MADACCGPALAPADEPQDEILAHEELIPWWRDRALLLPIAAGLLWALGMVLEWTGNASLASAPFVLGLAAGAWTFVPGTLRRLVQGRGRGRLGVGLLMTIAAIGAVLLGHLGEAAALAFLFSIAEALEDRAMDRATHGLRALLSLIPETALVARADGETRVPATEVRRGDVLLVGAGERVSTDGEIVSGTSWLDTSAITGESIPVEVAPGDAVAAGSVNTSGALRVSATADGRDNSLTQLVRLVEQAHADKGERARLADRIAGPLVPLVLAAAALVVIYGFIVGDPANWTERALVVLVAASTCALAIAVPVTVISAIGSASTLGTIIKSGAAFEQLGTIRTVAFDKTGTLTRNEPRVVETVAAPGRTEEEVLAVAAALEATSRHPLATAVAAASPEHPQASDVTELAGHGLTGRIGAHEVRVGSPRWIVPAGLEQAADDMADAGMSVVVVEIGGAPSGVIGIRDELRPEAAEAIATLHADGVSTLMLTGDNSRTAHALAAEVGIDRVHAQALPEDKARHVRESMDTTPTAMVGDGINDAPALASATVGIAMGATGSAAAVESADVAFTGHDLRLLPEALRHARRGRAIMTQNVVLSVLLIAALFPLALFGVLGLAAVVLVHEVAEVLVIANGLRAIRRRRPAPDPTTSTTRTSLPSSIGTA